MINQPIEDGHPLPGFLHKASKLLIESSGPSEPMIISADSGVVQILEKIKRNKSTMVFIFVSIFTSSKDRCFSH
jgi:hypothetical protein